MEPSARNADLKGRRLGRILEKMGKVTRDQIAEVVAFQDQQANRSPIGQIFLDSSYIDRKTLQQALAAQQGLEFVNLDGLQIDPAAAKALPANFAASNKILPIKLEPPRTPGGKPVLTVAVEYPNILPLDEAQRLMAYEFVIKVADAEQLNKALLQTYNLKDVQDISELFHRAVEEVSAATAGKSDFDPKAKNRAITLDTDSVRKGAETGGVVMLVNSILLQAIRDRASDVHFEVFKQPGEGHTPEMQVRYRVDGVLLAMKPIPINLAASVIGRIKVMANLDVAELRKPQDGRIEMKVNQDPIDLRVSVINTEGGGSVAIRILDRRNVDLDLGQLGLRENDLADLKLLLTHPNGILVVTGPTGSGKSTTLQSGLNVLNDPSSKLITVEDPVEYEQAGLVQVGVDQKEEEEDGLTFARALRAILRQDPDIIMVGELRDGETAMTAVQAALTGHLVLTTLHTNDAPGTFARLIDLKVEPYLVGDVVRGVIAQRLVRKICSGCKTAYTPNPEQLEAIGISETEAAHKTFYCGSGCDACNHTGYKGRMMIAEVLKMDDEISRAITEGASTQRIRYLARKAGMRSLLECGRMAIFDGVTTIEEVARETLLEE